MVVVIVDLDTEPKGIAQWLERLTADQQVPGSLPGGGHGLSSRQDPTISRNQIIRMYNIMSPIRTVITTITRKSIKMVAELDKHVLLILENEFKGQDGKERQKS